MSKTLGYKLTDIITDGRTDGRTDGYQLTDGQNVQKLTEKQERHLQNAS